MTFWYDGRLIEGNSITLDINEPGLLYGATVFTTMRVYQQSLVHPLTNWSSHCDRLRHSLESFGWQFPDWHKIEQGARALLPYFPVLRMVIFADGREWIMGRSLPADIKERQQQGIVAIVAEDPLYHRELATYKTGNYLGAWLALQESGKRGAKEAILIDGDGNWLETSTGNLWGWKDGCWWTPSLEVSILPGIARAQLLRWLKSQDIPVKENIWSENFIKGLEAIAYTNCVMEVIPFHTIMSRSSKFTINPNHQALSQLRACFQH